ncbi:MAG: lysophospholipid acyltransferase family protein [Oceanicaulis sp.]
MAGFALMLRRLLLVLILRPFAWLVIGVDVRGRRNLPASGPAIVAANHNSHIDTLLLICLFPSRLLRQVRPVAAADHFFKTPLSSWFARHVLGALPVERANARRDMLAGCEAALKRGEILLIFPEGTRGEAEELGDFKTGIARLAERAPDAAITPVYLQGAGRVLPRGSRLFTPFNCAVIVGEPFTWCGDRKAFMTRLRAAIEALKSDAPPLRWL